MVDLYWQLFEYERRKLLHRMKYIEHFEYRSDHFPFALEWAGEKGGCVAQWVKGKRSSPGDGGKQKH